MKSGITKLLTGLSLVSVALLGAVTAGASPVIAPFSNGNFAIGSYVPNYQNAGYDTLFTGSTAISGWTVGGTGTGAGVDWIGSYWSGPTSSDPWSIDLNGNAPGSISQTFATVSGATYDVSFSYAGNFDNYGNASTGFASNTIKKGTVQATGILNVPNYFYANWFSGWSHSNMGWASITYQFTATSDATTLTFTGDSNTGGWGPVIADVSVAGYANTGAQCKNGNWQSLTDLDTGMLYMNQGQCVSYFATNHDVPIGS